MTFVILMLVPRDVARIFQRGVGGESNQVAMSFSSPVVGCLLKKAYKRAVRGQPWTSLAAPLVLLFCCAHLLLILEVNSTHEPGGP